MIDNLTIYITARNEEAHIAKCIESAIEVNPGEIILGDNCSNDDTVKIAKSMGVRVINVPVNIFAESGFAGAYNFIAGHANTEWVLNLLGDCYIANPVAVNKILSVNFGNYYWVKFFRPCDGNQHYTAYPASHHGRLYKKDEVAYLGLAHEDLCDISTKKPKWLKPFVSDIHICHQNKQHDRENFDPNNPLSVRKTILGDYLLAKMRYNPELRFFVNNWWFQQYIPENKERIHTNAKRIREIFPALPKEEWEDKL